MSLPHLFKQIAWGVFTLFFSSALFAQNTVSLDLNDAERRWLAQHPVIRLASDIAWPPFEWVDDEKQFKGIATDYMHLIEKRLGIRFEVDTEMNWPEVVDAVKQRQLDVFSCVAKTPERESYVNFTRPYLSFPMVIVTTQDVSYIDGINGIKDMLVSVVKGYATHEFLAANHPEIKLALVDTSEEGMEAVSLGRANAFVDNIATATRIIQNSGLTNLKISGEMPIRYELHMAVRSDWPELVSILQTALDSISDSERRDIHNRWIGVRYEHGIDYGLFWKSFSVFILILGFLYFYNRKLANEIAHRKKAEENAMKARDDADKANQAKSEFLSVMSHELRTPLTSIKGALGLLTNDVVEIPPEKARNMLHIANDNCDRLILLINDILDIEKLLAGKMVFQNQIIVVGDLIARGVSANQGYADHYGVSLMVNNNECEDCLIDADESRMMQVLSNLISNAVKFSPANGCVRINTQRMGTKVRISVVDDGEGIPTEFRNQIFTHFSQADSSDTREKSGTGLGLAICREIMQRQGGEIGFVSETGQGSRFYFELKLCEK